MATKKILQNQQSKNYFYYINAILSVLVSKEDLVSYNTAKNIIMTNPSFFTKLQSYLTQENAIRMAQLVMNFAIFFYQYIYPATWFTYYISTYSGLKKILHCIFVNPVYGILFYCTFYMKMLGDSDKKHFNEVSALLNLPKHEDIHFSEVLVDSIQKNIPLPEFLGKDDQVQKQVLSVMVSETLATTSQISLEKIFKKTLGKGGNQEQKVEIKAVYLPEMDNIDFNDSEIQEQLELIKNEKRIKKELKKEGFPLKNKGKKKEALERIKKMYTSEGKVVCLDKCKERVKTKMGCYCDSECGKSNIFGKSWCYVSHCPKKIKKLPKTITGYSYDYCEGSRDNSPDGSGKYKKCFTGIKYENC
jgi:hypothetical protein